LRPVPVAPPMACMKERGGQAVPPGEVRRGRKAVQGGGRG
jgi:hypothetical protein